MEGERLMNEPFRNQENLIPERKSLRGSLSQCFCRLILGLLILTPFEEKILVKPRAAYRIRNQSSPARSN